MIIRLTLCNASFITVVNAAQTSVNSSGSRLIVPQKLGNSALYIFFCTVHFTIIIKYKPKICTFSKLIFQFLILMSSTCFEPKGSSSGRQLYMQLWYIMFYMLKVQYNAVV
jgi:hypothetical protein